MITKTFIKQTNSDWVGAIASGLCLVHCLATPLIFIAQAETALHHHDAPLWWQSIDLIFIGISFLAVYWSAIKSSKTWMKYALWISWIGLSTGILNEKLGLLHLPEISIYIPAIALVGLHLYNRKYCQCEDENCCATTN